MESSFIIIVNFDTRTRMVAGPLQKSTLDLVYTSVHHLAIDQDFTTCCAAGGFGCVDKERLCKKGVTCLDWRK